MSVENQHRYQGTIAGALLLVLVGVYLGEPWIVVLAGIPLGFLIFGAISGVPEPAISVEREISPTQPLPTETVTVRLTVTNEGKTNISDLRLIDSVPETLSVTDGSAAVSTALVPGQSETLTYVLETKRGTHSFAPPDIRVRGLAANTHREISPSVTGDTEFEAHLFFEEPPTVRETATLVGAVTSDNAGSGVEFHTVRQYRPGDPVNRIEWRRFARDDELATVNFKEYGGLSICVLVDCRAKGDVLPSPSHLASSDLCRYAADRIVRASTNTGHRTGLGIFESSFPWVSPDISNVYVHARSALEAVADGNTWDGLKLQPDTMSDATTLVDIVTNRLQARTQVVIVTPLGDDVPVEFAQQLVARNYRVHVVSPGPGVEETPGTRLIRAERSTRIQNLRTGGVTVIDWDRTEQLPVALSTATVGGPL